MSIAPLGTKSGGLQWALCILLKQHEADGALPTSGRFLFYELSQAGVIDKHQPEGKKRTPAQDLADASMDLRVAGLVPWWWITDETRQLTTWRSASTVYEYIAETVDWARIDCWGGSPAPLILTESRSLAQVLDRTARDFLCPIAPTNGQVGGLLHTDIIPLINGDKPRPGDKPRRPVLYLGDLDNQGADIEANTRRVIEAETGRLDWERLALTQAQVDDYQIPPTVKTDKRHGLDAAKRTGLAYETEAIGQTVIVGLVRARLTAMLPVPLDTVMRREADERKKARATLARLVER